jgi:hypothetical protein
MAGSNCSLHHKYIVLPGKAVKGLKSTFSLSPYSITEEPAMYQEAELPQLPVIRGV